MGRPVTDDDTGLKVLYQPPEGMPINLDIVAIHGIGAHPDDTWCKKIVLENGEVRRVNWLENPEMLPSAVPNARIMRYGYKSAWFGDEVIQQNVTRVADRFLRALIRERKDPSCKTRPLLLVAHCFGGLVALQALLKAERDAKKWPNIYHTVTGMAFFGTPFRGAEQVGQIEMIQAAQTLYEDKVQSEVLRITRPGDELLMQIVHEFGEMRNRTKSRAMLTCFFELIPYNLMAVLGQEGKKSLRVDETAGCLDGAEKIGLQRTHFDMNKFGKPREEEYLTVLDEIKKMVEAAPDLLAAPSQHHASGQSIPGYPQDTRKDEGLDGFKVTGPIIRDVTGNVDARLFNASRDMFIWPNEYRWSG